MELDTRRLPHRGRESAPRRTEGRDLIEGIGAMRVDCLHRVNRRGMLDETSLRSASTKGSGGLCSRSRSHQRFQAGHATSTDARWFKALGCDGRLPFGGYRSSEVIPVCFAMRASMRGPISSPSWNANTTSCHPSRDKVRCDPDCRFSFQPIENRAAVERLVLTDRLCSCSQGKRDVDGYRP